MMDCSFCDGADRCLLHDHMDPDELTEFKELGTPRDFPKKAFIFHRNATPEGLWVLRQGRIKITRSNSNGRSLITRMLFSGDMVGYRALLAEEPYQASAQAMETCACTFIPGSCFKEFVQHHQEMSYWLLVGMARQLGEADNRTERIALQDARSRVVNTLVELSFTQERFRPSETGRVAVEILRRDLAELVGLTVETTVRVIKALEGEGLLHLEGRKIFPTDRLLGMEGINTAVAF